MLRPCSTRSGRPFASTGAVFPGVALCQLRDAGTACADGRLAPTEAVAGCVVVAGFAGSALAGAVTLAVAAQSATVANASGDGQGNARMACF